MINYFTPDSCPLQVGSVLHNTNTNTDYMVISRSLDYTNDRKTDANKALVAVQYFNTPESHWLSGKDLAGMQWEYYPNWPDASVTKPCYHEFEYKEDSMTDIEFARAVFDAAKKLPGAEKLYEPSDMCKDVTVWDDDIHNYIQESIVDIIDKVQELAEKKE